MRKYISMVNNFARAFSYLGQARKRYIIGIVLGSFDLALLFATPFINQMLIDTVTGKIKGNLLVFLGGMFVLYLLLVPLVAVGKYFQNTAVAKGVTELRKVLFRKIIKLPYPMMTKYKTGDYIIRMTDDVNRTIGVFSSFAMICLVRFVVVFCVTLVLLLFNDWRIALSGVIYGIITLILSILLNPYTKKLEAEAKVEIVHSANFFIEVLRNTPVVRIFMLYPVISKKYQDICSIIRKKKEKFTTVNGMTYGIIDFFTFSAQAVGFFTGIMLAGNEMALGKVVFNATLMGMMGDAMLRLSTFLLLIQPNLVSMERLFKLIDQPSEELNALPKQVETDSDEAVVFKDLSFSYEVNKPVLEHLSFTLHRGEHLAIVGSSGSGKSTIIKLMLGFFEPIAGTISYFGVPAAAMSKTEIRSFFAYVPQECTLFDGTIGENIALGNPLATQEEIENAARIANIHDFIISLPEQYNTPVGERGGQLSGGQRQRIALARAILKDAAILLLDEATSSLDSRLEDEVQKCIDTISQNMTTVTVAHRLSTIRNADRILVLEDGKVVEEGTFHELLEKNGKFKELYMKQKS